MAIESSWITAPCEAGLVRRVALAETCDEANQGGPVGSKRLVSGPQLFLALASFGDSLQPLREVKLLWSDLG